MMPSPNRVLQNRCHALEKVQASTTQVHGMFPRALHFDLTWWRRYWEYVDIPTDYSGKSV